jgi:parallel beta-helix repeat protein
MRQLSMNAKKILIACLASCMAAQSAEIVINVGAASGAKSIEEALAKARAQRKPGDTARLVISGTHFLQKPLVLTEVDSGTTLDGGGKATVSGGRVLKGWRKAEGDLWQLEIPEVRDGKWYFRQLFVNGERRQRARTPNTGYFRIDGPSPHDKPAKLKFKAGDIKKEWADAGDVEVVAYIAWTDLHMAIRAVNEAAHVATLAGNAIPSIQESNAQYFIENAPDGLDAPGEWGLDRKTGVLRYWPLPGEDMSRVEVIAPVLNEFVTVRGNADSKKAAENIVFRGITFAHADYTLPADGIEDPQAAASIRGQLLFEFARDCRIQNCVLKNLAGYGIELGRGAQRNKITRCEIADLGAGGVRIGEPTKRSEAFDQNFSNEISDCRLHKLGRVFAPAVGVFILQSGTNLISHNEISDLYYTAISVGWNWGYQETPCRKNVIEFNHLHDVGQGLLSDMGGVYTLGIQRGTVVRNNLIHDVNAFTYGGWGLYTDEGSSDILLENNIVYRCKSAGFHQHYGRDNVIRNNIFAFNKEHQLMRTREEEHSSFTFERNIVYFDSGNLLGSNWKNDHFTIDNNIYFDTRPNAQIKFSEATLEQWQTRGHDKNSLIADPQFVDTAKNNFQLKPNSPALKIGFEQIDTATIGPRRAK